MPRPRTHALICLLLVAAAAGAEEHGAPVDSLYRASGLEKQVDGLVGQVVEGLVLASQGGEMGLTPEAGALLAVEARKAFAPERVGGTIRAELERELAPADIESVLAWLRSPLGERLTRMEEEASTVEAFAAMAEFGRGLQANPPDERRLAQINRLLLEMNGLEAAVGMALGMQMAVVTGVVAATPGTRAEDLTAAVRELEQLRTQLAPVMEAQVLVVALYTYRDASSEDLQGYIEFAETAAGRRYHAATFQAFERAMIHSSQRLGQGVVRALSGGAA